jgi:type I restriction enzyme R subunit
LIIATIFSFSANEDDPEDAPLPDEDFNTELLDKNSRDFLDNAIVDYNKSFSVNYDT